MKLSQKLNLFYDAVHTTERICYWELDKNFKIHSTNCLQKNFFYSLFLTSETSRQIQTHFSKSNNPFIFIRQDGIAWLIAQNTTDKHHKNYYLLGPVMINEYFTGHFFDFSTIPANDNLPFLSLNLCHKYLRLFFYVLTKSTIEPTEIIVFIENKESNQNKLDWRLSQYHGTWNSEQIFFNKIRTGDLSILNDMNNNLFVGQTGKMVKNNPLRQIKNEMIVLITLITRASILGGMASESAYNLSDYYIQKIESTEKATNLFLIASEAIEIYVHRVNQLRQINGLSQVTLQVIDYIQDNITEKIDLNYLASKLGYTPYYLTHKFQKEYKQTIKQFILNKTIRMLRILNHDGKFYN
ncbi:AraC family transcriptional regulator [Aerococcaceae bacterium zg-ZJ1578]|uniref:hypothetical protein n=1 Tax=Aerococcaceae bacterium zg-252 TaxID=2796928 RepID=UPI001A3279FE|nr:AraC family transcriptional regulator [Aerococcaceae bacterium zg-1578]